MTNLLMYSSTNAAIANTLDTISDLSVGSNYYFGTTGDFEYTHSGSFLKFDVQSIIALKTILEAKLILYPVSLPKDSSGQYKVSATDTRVVSSRNILEDMVFFRKRLSRQHW